MKIILEVIAGPHRGRSFVLEGHDSFIVGRARCAHFRLPKMDPFFSRVHFMVEANPPHCRLADLGSTNGTRVNGRRVEATHLHDGDLIEGGDTVLKVSFIPPPKEPAADLSETSPCPPVPTKPSRQGPGGTEIYRAGSEASVAEALGDATVRDEPGPTVPGYQIVRELGRGGMGTVYLAKRLSDSSDVAVKTIRPAMTGSERDVQRFLREAEILRKLRHPHIVAFHEMGQAGDLLYFAMDYVPGTDVAKLLSRDGPLAIGRAVRMICEVLEALQYAHGQGFVHRDVKPANLLVSGEPGFESCKLADFGLARVYHASPLSGLTIMGDLGGTVPYMPPEQITNYRNASPPADQYSTAATLYRLLTNHHIFDFGDLPKEQQLAKVVLEEPVAIQRRRPHIPDGLARAIHRALQKDPAARFPDAVAFRDALLPFGGET